MKSSFGTASLGALFLTSTVTGIGIHRFGTTERRTGCSAPASSVSGPRAPTRSASFRLWSGVRFQRPYKNLPSSMASQVTGPHQRSGLDMAETEAQSLFPQIGKLFGLIEAGNRQMILRRAQILPYREYVDAARAKIAEDFDQFFRRLSQANHYAALGHHAGREFLGILQQR